MSGASTALLTDRYELTMLDAAIGAGMAETPTVFEVFTRDLPSGRRFGVFAGLERLLDAIESFRFGDAELEWLERGHVVSRAALDWLAGFRFGGDIDAYAEGELYTDGSPVLTVEAAFGEAVLLETLILSILNHDCAVAAAASLICEAAGGRPVIEMGSRRADPGAAVAAARAAFIGGFASTSNLEAGRRYGVPTAGTVAHAFVMLFDREIDAFRAQVHCQGPGTTILVDTFDTEQGIRSAVEAGGTGLAAVRIDSGDLAASAADARRLLDSLGATDTKIVLTGDLDAAALRGLVGAPADAYGVGTAVVTGEGSPSAGLVYKPVSSGGRPVAKASVGKATHAGRKWAWRVGGSEVVVTSPESRPEGGRALQSRIMNRGVTVLRSTAAEAREHHERVLMELPPGTRLTRLDHPEGLTSAPTA